MSIKLGVGGVVKSVNSVKLGVGGVVKSVNSAYNGKDGLRRQFLGTPTGLKWFYISSGILNTYSEYPDGNRKFTGTTSPSYTDLGIASSRNYNIRTFRSLANQDDFYIEYSFYINKNTTYPIPYLADYVRFVMKSTSSVKYNAERTFKIGFHMGAIFDNDDPTLLNKYTGYDPYPKRILDLYKFGPLGPLPTRYSITYTIKTIADVRYMPSFYSYVNDSDWTSGTAHSYTTTQNTSGKTSISGIGCGVKANHAANASLEFSIRSNTITMDGKSYPVYFTFGEIVDALSNK